MPRTHFVSRWPVLLLVGLFAVGACSDSDEDSPTDPGGDPSGDITTEEASVITGEIFTLSFTAMGQALAGGSQQASLVAGAAAAAAAADPVSVNVPCGLGGSIAANGDVTQSSSGSGFAVDMDMTFGYSDCGMSLAGTNSGASSAVVNGSMSMDISIRMDASGQFSGTQTMDWTGSPTFELSDGRGFTCTIDLSLSWDGQNFNSVNSSGTFCGESVDF